MGVESMFPGRGSIVDLSRGGQNDYSRRAKSGQVSFNVLETKSTPSDALVYPFRRPCVPLPTPLCTPSDALVHIKTIMCFY